jgi:gamma-glutamylcyclotransferase (GGCT)/AIG2-like uncharacterized protein YtfP
VSDDGVVEERLFVYGTLAPGRPNEHMLAEVDGEWETATVRGRLVPEGWGADLRARRSLVRRGAAGR